MDALTDFYRHRLNLPNAKFTRIDHEDAMVAEVFKISQPGEADLILKVCSRYGDFLRESYFLQFFADKLPVPRLIQVLETQDEAPGAMLMQCIEGVLLKRETIDVPLSREIGGLLAQIHLERVNGYGDITEPSSLNSDPHIPFTAKFEEGLDECQGHLPEALIQKCRDHFDKDSDRLLAVDGPCIIHRDFRPGNLIVANGHIAGIIDWSSARASFAEDDFCPLEFGEWSSDAACKKAFLAGYAAVRKVPDYEPLMPLLRLSRAVAAVGFTVKRGTWNSRNAKLYQATRRYLETLPG